MNQVQVVGSHNSYHVEAPKKERDLQGIVPSSIDLQYSHAALDVQFESQKVRSIEYVWSPFYGVKMMILQGTQG